MISTIKKYFLRKGKSRRLRFPGMILVNDCTSPEELNNRIGIISSECRKAGLGDIAVIPLVENVPSLELPNGTFVLNVNDLPDLRVDGEIVILFSDQHHVSNEWIMDLVQRTRGSKVPHCIDTDSTLIGHLQVKALFGVIPELFDTSEIINRFLNLRTQMMITDSSCAFTKAGVTPENVRSLYRQVEISSIPVSYIVETTTRCNYSCYMCPYHGKRQSQLPTYVQPGSEMDMPWDMFCRVIDEIAELKSGYGDAKKTIIPYNRGEILLYKNWRKALSYIKEKGLGAYFSTNGSLWTKEDVEFIFDIELDAIQLSIDGFNVKTHGDIRMNEDFSGVVDTLRNMVRYREEHGLRYPHIQIAHTINERNVNNVPKYVDYWIDKADALFLGPENYMEEINMNKKYKVEYSPVKPRPLKDRPPCNMLLVNIWIMADGECHLCIGSKKTTIGNITDSSVVSILRSDIRNTVLHDHCMGNFVNNVCDNCDHWFAAYWSQEENDLYRARLSPDTQYYDRKMPLNHWWEG